MKVFAFFRGLFHLPAGQQSRLPARSSTPLRIGCADLSGIPPAGELARLAVAGRHVVLQLPPSLREEKSQVIVRLAPLLPGHSVFDSGPGPGGTDCITVRKVLDERVVLESLPLVLRAIRDFSATADGLCRRLADAHGVRPRDLLARRVEIQRSRTRRLGGWKYYFHGRECCFTSRRTGQVLDVRIEFGEEFGVLDPYFLSQFVRTTAAHEGVARLLGDDFHDARRMMKVLKGRGLLRVVEVPCAALGGMVCRGLALDPAALQGSSQ